MAINPPLAPTPAVATVPEDQLLTPPMATITSPSGMIPATLGSYGWVFNDTPGSVVALTAPITMFEHEPTTIMNGAELEIGLSGEELRTPPVEMEAAVYNFDENSGFPTSPQGGSANELGFAVKTDPDQQLEIDPSSPSFTIDVPPGHYAIRVQGNWPPQPGARTPIYVTWVFNVEVT